MNKNHKKIKKDEKISQEEKANMVVGRLGQGMCLGLLIGSTMGAGTGDVLLTTGAGIVIGALLGASVGAVEEKKKK